jgi:hypothetical protein
MAYATEETFTAGANPFVRLMRIDGREPQWVSAAAKDKKNEHSAAEKGESGGQKKSRSGAGVQCIDDQSLRK